ncbi:MAG: 30S ribosomal protein S1 [Anaerolineales bacterium]|nr:30S ribosomal protein S1 [Anaerolineales bacterium]
MSEEENRGVTVAEATAEANTDVEAATTDTVTEADVDTGDGAPGAEAGETTVAAEASEEADTASAEESETEAAVVEEPAEAEVEAPEAEEAEGPAELEEPEAAVAEEVEETDEEAQEATAEAAEEPGGAEKEAEEKPKPKRKKKKKTPLSELTSGAETSGRVVGIADFGAFVDIGADTDGLVHISELSEGRVKKVSDAVSVGQQIDVWIKDVDVNKERISLSMKSKPDYRLSDLKPGMVVEGVITGIRNYGAFVDIGSETEGLVHVSEMAEGYVNKPSELVSVGEELEVQVKKVDRRRRRISLSMKGVGHSMSPPPSRDEVADQPTAMELAMRQALGNLEEEIDETSEAQGERDAKGASRDELSDVFNRMLSEYDEDDT